MNITCSKCKTEYPVILPEIEAIEHRTFKCGECGDNIKVLVCPSCGKLYSLTYHPAQAKKYTVSCNSCSKRFVFTLPSDDYLIPTYRKQVQVAPKKNKHEAEKRPDRSIHENFFSLKEFKEMLKSSFSKKRLLFSLFGIIIIASVNFLLRTVLPMLPDVLTKYGFSDFITYFSFLFIYTYFSACMYWQIFPKAQRQSQFFLLLGETGRKSLPLLAGAFFIVFVFWVIILIFNNVPRLSPILFGLVFLPIYLILFFSGIFSVAGFWLYPHFIMEQKGLEKPFRSFFSFVKKRFSTVAGMTLVITIAAMLSLGLASRVQYLVYFLLIKLAAFMNDTLVLFMSSLPSGITGVLDPTAPIRILTYLQVYQSIPAFVFGIVLFCLSLFLLSWLVSWVMGFSAKGCVALRRGLSQQDKKVMWIFICSVIVLVVALYSMRYIKLLFL